MSSLDKALIKVLEHGEGPKTRRRIEPTSKRELYVDEASQSVPEPAFLSHQPAAQPPDESANTEHPTTDGVSHLVLIGNDTIVSHESFVIQIEADLRPDDVAEIPGEASDPTVADAHQAPRPSDSSSQESGTGTVESSSSEAPAADAEFTPAWEVDAFQLPMPSVRMNEVLSDELDEVQAHLYRVTVAPRQIISIHSRLRGEGRTSLAIGLAKSLARNGRNVLIVDGDVDNPRLADSLGIAIEQGWETALNDETSVAESCIGSTADGFCVLPLADRRGPLDREQFGFTFRKLLGEVAKSFDVIILDAGHGGPVWGDALDELLAAQIVVRDVRLTSDDQLGQFSKSLSTRPHQCVETVDNFI